MTIRDGRALSLEIRPRHDRWGVLNLPAARELTDPGHIRGSVTACGVRFVVDGATVYRRVNGNGTAEALTPTAWRVEALRIFQAHAEHEERVERWMEPA